MSLSKLAVRKPTTVLIIFIVLTALGIYATTLLPIDLFPEMEMPYIVVSTTYTNASPEEVEEKVTRTLESSLSGISGLKTMQSVSGQGSSMIMLEFTDGTDLAEATNMVRDRIDLVRNYLPSEVTSPVILKMDPSMIPIMEIALTGERSLEELRQVAEDVVQPRLEQIDGVASVAISGGREKAINIDISRDSLEAYGLTITQVGQMLSAQNIRSASGSITESGMDYSVTTSGQFQSLDDIRNTVVAYKAGTPTSSGVEVHRILLGDVAEVSEGYKPISTYAYLNGSPCVLLSVQKQSSKNSVQTVEQIREELPSILENMPAGVELVETSNTTDIINEAISTVLNSAIQGAVLAVLVLLFFLRSFKSTGIIGLTIPVSLIVTLGIMYFAGHTLNMMTLAGLALGVGMLVDNSIVILENIYSYREKGAKPDVAAILGSQEMTMAITSSTLTTICVFLPMIMFGSRLGMMKQVFMGLAFTVVISLVCSLLFAIVLVPVLASKYLKLENVKKRNKKGLNKVMTRFFDAVDNGYSKAVRFSVRHKLLIIAIVLIALVLSVMAIPRIGFVYMPEQEDTTLTVNLTMPQGTNIEVTNETICTFEALVRQNITGVKSSTVSIGGSSIMGGGTNSATLTLSFYSPEERKGFDAAQVATWDTVNTAKEKLRPLFNVFPGANFTISSSSLNSLSGGGVDIAVKGDDMDAVRAMTQQIKTLLQEEGGEFVTDVGTSMTEGLPQVELVIDRERMYALGLTIAGVNSELKANIDGLTIGRYYKGGEEIDIIIGLPDSDKARLVDLEQVSVTNSSGTKVSLSNFATYVETTSPTSILRENQARSIHVTAIPAPGLSIDQVQKQVENLINTRIPADDSVFISFGGDYKMLMEGLETFFLIIIMAVILVFAVMASQFESFKDPFIVLFTIPLSVVGIVVVYLLMGKTLSMITAIGALILVGIIVNNGIVLIDYMNLLRKRGYGLEDACVAAAKSRLRPILMTTLTTVLALVPMTFSSSGNAALVQPIGMTVLGGLSFGTLMTLFLMPVLYYLFNHGKDKRMRKKRKIMEAAAEASVYDVLRPSTAAENDNAGVVDAVVSSESDEGQCAPMEAVAPETDMSKANASETDVPERVTQKPEYDAPESGLAIDAAAEASSTEHASVSNAGAPLVFVERIVFDSVKNAGPASPQGPARNDGGPVGADDGASATVSGHSVRWSNPGDGKEEKR
jgi:HAE1 family hydrophobic/amphiphilic exporter-1